jgi:uncharacterized protein
VTWTVGPPKRIVLASAKVWIEILTPKQVLFFKPLVDLLKKNGHKVLATSRHYREVEPLARMHRLDLEFVGERGGNDRLGQFMASLERQRMLLPLVEEFEPNLSISVASVDCARISFGLAVRHIAVNDSPHSTVAGKLSLPLSHHLLTPWIIPYSAWSVFGLRRRNITRYRALDPAAWLKRPTDGHLDIDLEKHKKTIVVRLEESYAPYMAGTSRSWGERVLRRLAEDFEDCNLVALCRYEDQLRSIKERYGDKYIIPDQVIDGTALLKVTDVFVGMGGTMNAEAALQGVPTVSAFQGDLYTEKYLNSKGLMVRSGDVATISRLVSRFLAKGYRSMFSRKAKKLLDSMEDPIPKIALSIEKAAAQA